jgi:hypothetical protein
MAVETRSPEPDCSGSPIQFRNIRGWVGEKKLKGARKMKHYGTFVEHDGRFCVAVTSYMSNEPTKLTHIWPLGYDLHSAKVYFPEFLGKSALSFDHYGIDWTLATMPTGPSFCLERAEKTEALTVLAEPVKQPRCKQETRWHNGRWEKLTKKGWK